MYTCQFWKITAFVNRRLFNLWGPLSPLKQARFSTFAQFPKAYWANNGLSSTLPSLLAFYFLIWIIVQQVCSVHLFSLFAKHVRLRPSFFNPANYLFSYVMLISLFVQLICSACLPSIFVHQVSSVYLLSMFGQYICSPPSFTPFF